LTWSIGSASRRSGIDADIWATCSGVRKAATRAVSVVIGEIEFAVIPCGPSSQARKRVNWITPALAAP
jgi:hypothetical protein